MFIREIKENEDPMDVRGDWAAYRRMKRREREQRSAVIITGVGLLLGFALLVASAVVKARREAVEKAAFIEFIKDAQPIGGAQ